MKKYPNLDCQFYFLFRTELWQDGELLEESFRGHFGEIDKEGVKIDEDKRLFRYSFDKEVQEQGMQNWQALFADSWQNILQCYAEAYKTYSDEVKEPEKKAKQFCEAAFYGVALLIMDEDIARHQIEISLKIDDKKQYPLKFSLFERELLTVLDNEGEMPEPACCYAFELESKPTTDNHALKIEERKLYLVPAQPEQSAENPIFAVYAVQHSNSLKENGELLPWLEPFQDFLCGSPPEKNQAPPGLFVNVLSRLIMQQWQFQRIDCAAKSQRKTVVMHKVVMKTIKLFLFLN